jgi:hypothetical protein
MAIAAEDRAVLLFRLGRKQEALAAINQLLDRNSQNALALTIRGAIKRRTGDATADADLAAATAIDPTITSDPLTPYRPRDSRAEDLGDGQQAPHAGRAPH